MCAENFMGKALHSSGVFPKVPLTSVWSLSAVETCDYLRSLGVVTFVGFACAFFDAQDQTLSPCPDNSEQRRGLRRMVRLEALPELRVHPFARFFDFVESKDVSPEGSSKSEVHTSWLFIGLGFPAPNPVAAAGGTHDVDLTSVIRDFAYYTDQWEARHGGMDMQIDHVTRSAIPEWVLESVDNGASDSKHVQKKLSKKKKRNASDCNGVASGVNGTVAAGNPARNSSKKSKGQQPWCKRAPADGRGGSKGASSASLAYRRHIRLELKSVVQPAIETGRAPLMAVGFNVDSLFDLRQGRLGLLVLELGLALLDEGGHALLLVLGGEGAPEEAALVLEPLLQRLLVGGVDGLLGHLDHWLREGRDLVGRLERLVQQLVGGHDARHEAVALGLLRVDHVAREDHLHGLGLAHGADQALRAAAAGDRAERDLGLAELGRVAGDDEVAEHGELAAAAQRVAVDGGDHGLGHRGDVPPVGEHVALEGLHRTSCRPSP
ncbi:hypothetical protein ON010_g8741 [Phytophthora cinnamomi]|nr:hypothetical protein ON010_g8741 [Phytophthora cinnamomi]